MNFPGIYTLANDVVYDQVIALINSIEVNIGQDIPIYIILYDDRLTRIKQEIATQNHVSLISSIVGVLGVPNGAFSTLKNLLIFRRDWSTKRKLPGFEESVKPFSFLT